MKPVKPKKKLGQHFLLDENIAVKIVNALSGHENYFNVLELGPGTGVLTKYLLENKDINLILNEIDSESREYLLEKYPKLKGKIIEEDFLKLDLNSVFEKEQWAIIGNFPYNISSQIFFKVLEYKKMIPECVGMIQREVAKRICAPHGNKEYGILSVLIRAFYEVEYLFEVSPGVFKPPPKVWSAVIRMKRKKDPGLNCDEKLFFRVVKQSFQMRRKTLRNSLKPLNLPADILKQDVFNLRAEQLSVSDFIELTTLIEDEL